MIDSYDVSTAMTLKANNERVERKRVRHPVMLARETNTSLEYLRLSYPFPNHCLTENQ